MGKPFIIYGHQRTTLDMPPSWRLLTFADPGKAGHPHGVAKLVRRALTNPVHFGALKKRLASGDRVAIAVEDMTRSSPKRPMLEGLLGELRAIGLSPDQITILIALGTHRPLTNEELKSAFGDELVARHTFLNHDCRAPDLVPVGQLRTGATVKINRRFHQATFRIGVGPSPPTP
jgi:nickel-dependent lactate racemase